MQPFNSKELSETRVNFPHHQKLLDKFVPSNKLHRRIFVDGIDLDFID